MSDEIRFAETGGLATIELTRPKALNALTLDMIRAMTPQLDGWDDDDSITAVLIKGEGDRAFCAGGDVRAVYRSIVEDLGGTGPSDLSRLFFLEEYRLNHLIHAFSKPYVALLDGVTMGGGVGLSIHGSHRVATERLLFAMPETGIGLFPDVGGGWFLPRLPGEMGSYLALTGARLDAGTAVGLGLASHFVPSGRLAALEQALAAALASGIGGRAGVNDVLDRFNEPAGVNSLEPHRETIDRCFAGESVERIVEALSEDGSAFAVKARDALLSKSPTSLKISLAQLRKGREASSLADVLTMEYRMAQACMTGCDYFEGIRALLVDKDGDPQWRPADLAAVDAAVVARHFERPAGGDFTLA